MLVHGLLNFKSVMHYFTKLSLKERSRKKSVTETLFQSLDTWKQTCRYAYFNYLKHKVLNLLINSSKCLQFHLRESDFSKFPGRYSYMSSDFPRRLVLHVARCNPHTKQWISILYDHTILHKLWPINFTFARPFCLKRNLPLYCILNTLNFFWTTEGKYL